MLVSICVSMTTPWSSKCSIYRSIRNMPSNTNAPRFCKRISQKSCSILASIQEIKSAAMINSFRQKRIKALLTMIDNSIKKQIKLMKAKIDFID